VILAVKKLSVPELEPAVLSRKGGDPRGKFSQHWQKEEWVGSEGGGQLGVAVHFRQESGPLDGKLKNGQMMQRRGILILLTRKKE